MFSGTQVVCWSRALGRYLRKLRYLALKSLLGMLRAGRIGLSLQVIVAGQRWSRWCLWSRWIETFSLVEMNCWKELARAMLPSTVLNPPFFPLRVLQRF